MKTSTLALSAFLMSSVCAFAQEAESPSATFDLSPAISELVESLEAGGHVEWVDYADLDADGDVEAIIKLNSGYDPNNPSMKEWRVIDEQDGMGVQAGSWIGNNVSVMTIETGDETLPLRSIIYSDGSYWSMLDGVVYPYGDLVSQKLDFIQKGLLTDANLFAEFGFTDVATDFMARVTLDVASATGDEILISLVGDAFWKEEDASTPYILMTASGEKIHSGWSYMHPAIYKTEDGGFQIIEDVDDQYRGIVFPGGM